MNFRWTLLPSQKIARLDLGGSLSAAALRRAHDAAVALEGWRTDYNLLVILSDSVRTEAVTLAEIEAHRAFMQAWNQANRTHSAPRTALICADDLKRSMARLWSMVTEENWPIKIAIFADTQAAMAWLNEGRDDLKPGASAGQTLTSA